MRVLTIYWDSGNNIRLNGIHEHLVALETNYPEHVYWYWDGYFGVPKWFIKGNFDLIILHTTFLCLREIFPLKALLEKTSAIKDMTGYKIAIPQDEYDLPDVLDQWFEYMRIDTVLTNLPKFTEVFYPRMQSRANFVKVLTGYVSERLLNYSHSVNHERKWDVGYRGSNLPFWFGSLGQLKRWLATEVADQLRKRGLCVNASSDVKDFLSGDEWYLFLCSCGVVLGSESGSSLLISDASLKSKVRHYLDQHPQASFEAVNELFFSGGDGEFHMSAISPRHFECAALKVCQVLVEGEYEGILKAGEHYISVNKNLSNIDEVVSRIKDKEYCKKIAETAYSDIACNPKYSYRAFAQSIVESVPAVQSARPSKLLLLDMKLSLYLVASKTINFLRPENCKMMLGRFLRASFPTVYSKIRGQ